MLAVTRWSIDSTVKRALAEALSVPSRAQHFSSAIDDELGSYAVLNACRALRLVREGVLCSKQEGDNGRSAKESSSPTLSRPLFVGRQGEDVQVNVEAAARFVARARAELLSESER